MKNLKTFELRAFAQQKTVDYIRRHIALDDERDLEERDLLFIYDTEYRTCMDLFIAGYRFAENLNDFEEDFGYIL